MKNQGNYLPLLQLEETSFSYDGKTYNLAEAPEEVFNAWIRLYVEEVTGVDQWTIHHRWQVVNDCISAGILDHTGGHIEESKEGELDALNASAEVQTLGPFTIFFDQYQGRGAIIRHNVSHQLFKIADSRVVNPVTFLQLYADLFRAMRDASGPIIPRELEQYRAQEGDDTSWAFCR